MLTLIEAGKGLLNTENGSVMETLDYAPWPCGHNACEICGFTNQTKFLKMTQSFYHS